MDDGLLVIEADRFLTQIALGPHLDQHRCAFRFLHKGVVHTLGVKSTIRLELSTRSARFLKSWTQ